MGSEHTASMLISTLVSMSYYSGKSPQGPWTFFWLTRSLTYLLTYFPKNSVKIREIRFKKFFFFSKCGFMQATAPCSIHTLCGFLVNSLVMSQSHPLSGMVAFGLLYVPGGSLFVVQINPEHAKLQPFTYNL